jgi:hypothetical protein
MWRNCDVIYCNTLLAHYIIKPVKLVDLSSFSDIGVQIWKISEFNYFRDFLLIQRLIPLIWELSHFPFFHETIKSLKG